MDPKVAETGLADTVLAVKSENGSGSTLVDPMIGRLFGSYRIIEKLGEGGMGVVYLAEDENIPGRRVVIKTMRTTNEEALARFYREATTTGNLKHYNIVVVYSFSRTEDGLLYIAMEHLIGQDLSAYTDSPLAVESALTIAISITKAMQVAHDKGILHRDLKPANVFLAEMDGGDICVKILDFGLALFQNSDVRITKTGMSLGTLAYISPEQFMDASDIGPGTDIYALGCIMYEMLSGNLPRGNTVTENLRGLNNPDFRPDPLPSNVPKALCDLVMSAMAHRVEDRPLSMADFGEELEKIERDPWAVDESQDDAEVEVSAITPHIRKRVWVIPVAIVALVVIIAGVFVFAGGSEEEIPASPASIASPEEVAPAGASPREDAQPVPAEVVPDAVSSLPSVSDGARGDPARVKRVKIRRHRPKASPKKDMPRPKAIPGTPIRIKVE